MIHQLTQHVLSAILLKHSQLNRYSLVFHELLKPYTMRSTFVYLLSAIAVGAVKPPLAKILSAHTNAFQSPSPFSPNSGPRNSTLIARQSPVGGHDLSELRCVNPSSGSPDTKDGTARASASDLHGLADFFADPNKYDVDYCVQSDGSRKSNGADNWALAGNCGDNDSAAWLQSFVCSTLIRSGCR